MQLPSAVGCANFRSSICLSSRLQSSVTTLALYIYMTANPVHHCRTKHIEIDIHFVQEKVALGEIRVLHVPSSSHQFADIMNKGLPVQLFSDFRSSLCVCQSPASIVGSVRYMYI